MSTKKFSTLFTYLISFNVIIIIWIFLASKIDSTLILPQPSIVFKTLLVQIGTKIFWKNFLSTFLRVLISFFLSIIFGAIIGFLCGISKFAKDFFEFPMAIIRATPVIAIILVAYYWFKSTYVPVFVTVLMTLPIIITSVTTGFENADKNLLKMAKSFNFSNKEIIMYIQLPACYSNFLSGAVSCFGLSWKVVAAGEVICLPKYAVGTLLQNSQMHLETDKLIAQTIVLVLISFIIERFFSVIVKKEINKND